MPENKVQIVVEVDAKTGQATIRQLGAEMDTAGKKGERGFGQATAGVDRLGRSMAPVIGLARNLGLTLGAMEISKAVVQGTLGIERMELALRSATGSAEGAGEELGFVRGEAERLGLELMATGKGFTTIAAAAKGTELAGAGVRDIFSGIAEASAVLSLSAAETNGALLAVGQMISKGKVNAEELRLQLGERLPGAFQIAARAMGVTTQELDKMLEKGEIMASDFLPRFATELHKTFGPDLETAAGRSQAAFNRLMNAITDMEVAIGNSGLISFLAKTADFSAKVIQGLTFLAGAPKIELKGMELFQGARLKEFMNADLLLRKKMVEFEERLRSSKAKSDALIYGETKTGSVLDDGALDLEFRAKNSPDDKAAEKMREARQQWENKADLAGLTGVEEQLRKIGQEADELRQKFGNKGWIDAGQAERENAAIRADLEKTTEQMTKTRSEYEKKTDLAGLEGIHKELKEIGQEAAGLAAKYGSQGWIDTWQAEAEQAAIAKDRLKEQKEELEKLGKVRDAYHQAMIASLPEEEQAVARVTEEYRKQQIAVLDALNAGEISADEAWARSEALSQRETEATRKALDSLRDKGDQTKKIWEHTFDNLQDITADWLYEMKIDINSVGDLFRKMVAQMVSAWAWGQASMAWAGTGSRVAGLTTTPTGGGTSVASSVSGISALLSSSSMSGTFKTAGVFGLDAIGDFAYDIGMSSVGDVAASASSWLNGLSSGIADGMMAGVGSLAISLLSGQGLTVQTGMQAAGAALGSYILPGIGTILGGIAGNFLGGLFGGDKEHEFTLTELQPYIDESFSKQGGLTPSTWTHPNAGNVEWYGPIANAYVQTISAIQKQFDTQVETVTQKLPQDIQDAFYASLESKDFSVDVRGRWGVSGAQGAIEGIAKAYSEKLTANLNAAFTSIVPMIADELTSNSSAFAILTAESQQYVKDYLGAGSIESVQKVYDYFGQVSAVTATIDKVVADSKLSDYDLQLQGINEKYAAATAALKSLGIEVAKTNIEQAHAIEINKLNQQYLDTLRGEAASAASAYIQGLEREIGVLQGNIDTARSHYLNLLGEENTTLGSLVGTLDSAVSSIRQARKSLYADSGSPIPGPAQRAAISAEIDRIMAVALGSDPRAAAQAMGEVDRLGGEYLSVTKGLQTDWREYARDIAKIDNLLTVTETQAAALRSDAQSQIGRLNAVIAAVNGNTGAALTIDQARRQYEASLYALESSGYQEQLAGMNAMHGTMQSIEALLGSYLQAQGALGVAESASAADPSSLPQTVANMYSAALGREADPEGLIYWSVQLAQAGGNINAIKDTFFSEAMAHGETVQRFAAGGSFEVAGAGGIDNLTLPGLRVTAGEMVHVSRPDTMAELRAEIRALRQEVAQLRAENNAGNLAIAKHTEKSASTATRWDYDGMPAVRVSA
ncbi:MAG: tape measure protein [Desulfobulbaceae bacterium]